MQLLTQYTQRSNKTFVSDTEVKKYFVTTQETYDDMVTTYECNFVLREDMGMELSYLFNLPNKPISAPTPTPAPTTQVFYPDYTLDWAAGGW